MNSIYNILIVEDNFSFSLELEMIVKALNHNVLASVDSSGDALVEILDKKPDLILMDIDINGKLTGIQIAEKVSHLKIPVIFITSFANDEHYDQASEILNSTYIIKPVDKYSLKAAISLLMKSSNQIVVMPAHPEMQLKDGALYLKKKDDFYKVRLEDIIYIESERVYCKTVTISGEEYLNRISLNEYTNLLNSPAFVRPHRSFLVNTKHIEKINLNENVLILKDMNIPISRNAKSDLKDVFKLIN